MKQIVVQAPSFDETSGGAIVLHYLVDRLRSLGFDAYVYPILGLDEYPEWPDFSPVKRIVTFIKNTKRRLVLIKKFKQSPLMDTPLASKEILRDAVIVYPEIISGNPLNSKYVVRWLLHKPGFFYKHVVFGSDELTFFFQHDFRDGCEWVDPENMLNINWVRDDIYFNQGLTKRTGACRLIRKGNFSGLEEGYDDEAIILDGMSHLEMAQIFNRTKFLFCHDPYTMYCYYAVLCGCVPIIVPFDGLSKEDWRSTALFKHGIAYGMDEAEWAEKTRGKLIDEFSAIQSMEDEMIKRFAEKISSRFSITLQSLSLN
jgi:hypothetical protein